MYASFKTALLASLALGALTLGASAPARAQDASGTAAEIRELKARLNALEKRLNSQAQTQAQTQAEVQRVVARGPLPTTKGGVPPLEYCPPGKFCYKGLTITPGGFFALEGVWRDHNMISDIDTPFQAVPYPNNIPGHSNEFRLSARQSRLSLLVEGKVNPVTSVSGYGEFDFLGAAQSANSNESNSYQPRVRHLYGAIDENEWGTHFLAGQTWSLATLNGFGGIKPRQEQIPLTIDAQYVPGFSWARQPQVRLVQDLGANFSIAASAETGATTFGGTVPADVANISNNACGIPGVAATAPSGFSLLNACNSYSFNQMPDLIAKASWNPNFAGHNVHMEGYGLFRQFTDETTFTAGSPFPAGTHTTTGGGFGGGIVAQVLPGMVDAQFSGLTGNGIGRYGSSQLPDVTFSSANGQLVTIPETDLLAGLIVHATSWLDVYGYAGEEVTSAKYTPGTASGFGWGNPKDVQTGCFSNLSTGTCVAYKSPKAVGQVTVGFWDTILKGDYGLVKWGLQYEFTQDQGFAGVGGTPKADENVVMTSFRYYPF
ncbi:MAG TPA: hypothetical protein VKS78_06130 [Roseiarcus sp.]|nr:hypothetical protein [Roseiarcus sp.]